MRGPCYFLLSVLTQVRSSTVDVVGFIGHNVTLPCKYSTQTHGVLGFCWGRGPLPRFHCADTILSSKDGTVPSSQSTRYQLLGETAGDLSLTIVNAQQSDAGVYGCRVEIPGWFNDYKVNTNLVMVEAPVEEVVTQEPTDYNEMLTVERPEAAQSRITLEKIISEEKFKAFLEVGNITRIGVISLVTIIIIISILWRTFKPRRSLQHPNISTVDNIYESVTMPD